MTEPDPEWIAQRIKRLLAELIPIRLAYLQPTVPYDSNTYFQNPNVQEGDVVGIKLWEFNLYSNPNFMHPLGPWPWDSTENTEEGEPPSND